MRGDHSIGISRATALILVAERADIAFPASRWTPS
jgi:hypothetical protein